MIQKLLQHLLLAVSSTSQDVTLSNANLSGNKSEADDDKSKGDSAEK